MAGEDSGRSGLDHRAGESAWPNAEARGERNASRAARVLLVSMVESNDWISERDGGLNKGSVVASSAVDATGTTSCDVWPVRGFVVASSESQCSAKPSLS